MFRNFAHNAAKSDARQLPRSHRASLIERPQFIKAFGLHLGKIGVVTAVKRAVV